MSIDVTIQATIGQGRSYDLNVPLTITVAQLKDQLAKQTNNEYVGRMWLVWNNEQLDDDCALADYDIPLPKISLTLIDTQNTTRDIRGIIGVKFIDVVDDRAMSRNKWSNSAPKWRKARPGMCLEGVCTNQTCQASGQMVVICLGYKTFNLITDRQALARCPLCKNFVRVSTCAFNNCWWKFSGVQEPEDGEPQTFSCDWRAADDAYHRINEADGQIVSWSQLVFEVKRDKSAGIQTNTLDVGLVNTAENAATARIPSPMEFNNEPPKTNRPDIEQQGGEMFAQPDELWCPWKKGSCEDTLQVRGQAKGAIEISLKEPKPFELQLSRKENPSGPNIYTIRVAVAFDQVTITTSAGTTATCKDPLYVLQPRDQYWHKYWISIYATDAIVKYGVGELRPFFTGLTLKVPETELEQMKEIYYLRILVDHNENMLDELREFQESYRSFIGKLPVRHEPPLFVYPEDKYTLFDKRVALSPTDLEATCRSLYAAVINVKLNTPTFDLAKAIKDSIEDSQGWCHRKLAKKANVFGATKPTTTYLRLTVGELEGDAPGHNYVIEVWPPGHNSPIHNHGNTYAIIRVLSGEIMLRVFPELRLNARQFKPIEQLCKQGGVTWMSPNLNQTHQLQHIDPHGDPCITIQCYKYGPGDREHHETFDFIANDNSEIRRFTPTSDMDFKKFRKVMENETKGIYIELDKP